MHTKKHKFLTLKEKYEILEHLQKGASVTNLAKRYGVTKSTVSGIKKNKNSISKCVNNTFIGPGKRKTMRPSEYPKMEKSLYKWFMRMRDKKFPISGLMLKEKAKELHYNIKENNSDFNASDGWLQNFKKRFGVRLLQISGEKLSAQPQLVEPFKVALRSKIEELGLSNDQLYNADESGLFWKILPTKTYVSSQEKSAPGTKTEKQRITFLCCANATGSHQLKLLVVGKSKKPRCFQNFNCPVHYRHSKSAWMTGNIFKDWFHHSFVPEVNDLILH